jgi:hypothetical protein
MNWTMLPRIKSRIGTATAAGALIAISALIVPAQASATSTPLNAPDYAIEATTLFGQTNCTRYRLQQQRLVMGRVQRRLVCERQ